MALSKDSGIDGVLTIMKKIEIHMTVTLNLSADDWQLYDRPGREEAATKLNREIEEKVKNAPRRSDFRYGDLLSKQAEYGANDSEGFGMLESILDKVYPNWD